MKSLVITIIRRPLDGTLAQSALEHGTGAININASRISLNGGTKQATAGNRTYKDDSGWGVDAGGCSYEKGTGAVFTDEGRWPTNLILAHKPGCECVGVKKVDGQNPKYVGKGKGKGDEGVYGPYSQGRPSGVGIGYGDSDGKETVENWVCVEDCPVRNLDAQSGISVSSVRQGGVGEYLDPSREGWRFKRAEGGFADKGGASRFYKQFKRDDMNIPEELIDYLRTMISPPPGIEAQVLVASNPRRVDWEVYEDEQFHGLVIKGDLDFYKHEIWRVLKPGAHIMSIAPDLDPTNHLNACSMEDKGFEIRDAILVLLEPGATHYVAKASSKERNLGFKGKNKHPTVKPKDLCAQLCADIPEGATILDPFMGSGTTGIGCIETGHSFVGIEMQEEFVDLATKRLKYWAAEAWHKEITIESEAEPEEEEVSLGGILGF